MILYLNALQLNVSHFGRIYMHHNGVNEMAGLRTNASVRAYGPTNTLKGGHECFSLWAEMPA